MGAGERVSEWVGERARKGEREREKEREKHREREKEEGGGGERERVGRDLMVPSSQQSVEQCSWRACGPARSPVPSL
jgi:hypothetical protein